MTFVKICGVTTPEDAALAAALGAAFLGLNFHPPSPRVLDPTADAARLLEIADAAHAGGARLVGVFVHRTAEEIEAIAASARLDLVQLHGDQSAQQAARFGGRAIRVFRQGGDGAMRRIAAEIAVDAAPWGYLFDTPAPTSKGPSTAISGDDPYGGTGESWDHGAVRHVTGALRERGSARRPVLIAGGLAPGNVRAALAASGADGADVCSGVESAPGVKDADLMRRLFEEIRDGDAAP